MLSTERTFNTFCLKFYDISNEFVIKDILMVDSILNHH